MSFFQGFSPQVRFFLGDLATHNNQAWFRQQERRFQEEVLAPLQEFVTIFGRSLTHRHSKFRFDPAFNGRGSIVPLERNDPQKPYKTALDAVIWLDYSDKPLENAGIYLHLDANQALLYAGLPSFSPDQLDQYRDKVMDKERAKRLHHILNRLEEKGLVTGLANLDKLPVGYSPTHDFQDLLLMSSLWARSQPIETYVLEAPSLLDHCLNFFEQTRPLLDWLETHLHKNL